MLGRWEQALKPDTFRQILAFEKIDCYVVQLGTNDLKFHTPDVALDRMWELINRLNVYTSANLVINCVLPVTHDRRFLNRILRFNELLTNIASHVSNSNNFAASINIVRNSNFFNYAGTNTSNIDHLFIDGIHLNQKEGGLRMLCANITKTVLSSFDIDYVPRHTRRGGSSFPNRREHDRS